MIIVQDSTQSCPRNWIRGTDQRIWWFWLSETLSFQSKYHLTTRFKRQDLAAKRATRSSRVIIHDCPLSYVDARAPKLHGYETYATFHNTSMEQDIIASSHSIPMTLHFAILEFSCPEIVFLSLPKRPPDGFMTSFMFLLLITTMFTIITTRTCLSLS